MYKVTLEGHGYNKLFFAFATWKAASDFMYEAIKSNVNEDGLEATIREADYNEDVFMGYISNNFVPIDDDVNKVLE